MDGMMKVAEDLYNDVKTRREEKAKTKTHEPPKAKGRGQALRARDPW